MKKLFWVLLLLPFLVKAQANDTSYYDFVHYADEEYAIDNTNIVAYQYYIKAIVLASETGPAEEYYKSLARVYEVTAAMSYDYELYAYANLFYERSLGFYRALEDLDGVVRVIPKIALSYQAMRLNDVNVAPQASEEEETAEVYYRIIEDPIYYEEYVELKINGGITDGLYPTSVGYVYATDKEPFVSRANTKLGSAKVLQLDTNATTLRVHAVDPTDSFYLIYKGDMVMMLSLIPKREFKSILWQLALKQVIFLNQNSDPIYDYRQLLSQDSEQLEDEILEIMQRDVYTTWEMLRDLEDRSQFQSIFEDKLESGRYKGFTVYEAMEKTTKEDVRAFLGFVKTFPGKYMGIPYKINETYATWVMNKCLIGFDEFYALTMAAKTDAELKEIATIYADELVDDDYFTYLTVEAENLAEAKNYEEAFNVNQRVIKLSSYFENKAILGWAYFNRARIFDFMDNDDSTEFYYETALRSFEKSNEQVGKSFCLNNLASIYEEWEQYEKANQFYRNAYKAKLALLNMEGNTVADYGYSLSKSCSGIGNTEYLLANYDSAISAYTRGIWWADQVGSLESKTYAVSLQTDMARVYKKRGQYGLASELYADQVKRYLELGEKAKVADAYDNEADVLFSKGEYQQALEKYLAAHDIKIKLEDWSGAGFSLSNCGQAMWNLGNLDSAISYHNKALSLRELGNDQKGMAYSVTKMADLYKEQGQPEVAGKYYEKALRIYQDFGDSLKVAELALSIGDYYYDLKNYTSALEFYDYSLAMYLARGMKSEVATVYAYKGYVYDQLKDYKKAKTLHLKALEIRKEINERQSIMYSLVDLSSVLMISEFKFDTALVLLNDALALAKETGSNDYEAYCYHNIGNAYFYRAKTSLAEENFRAALTLYEKTGNISNRCYMLLNLGSNEMQRGNFKGSMDYYNQSLELAKANNLSTQIANTYNYMAEFYYYMGEFQMAFNVIDSSYRLYITSDNPYGLANTHIVHGNTHNLIGNAPQALKQYHIADSIYGVINDPLSRATALNNMGTIHFFQGDYDGALLLFNQCKTIFDTTGMRSSLLNTVIGNFGEVYMEKGIWDESEKWLKEGIALAQELGSTRQEWGDKATYAKLLYKKGKYQESADLLLECYAAFKLSDEKMNIADCATHLGKAYYKLGQLTQAETYYNEALQVYRNIGSRKLIWEPLYQLALVAKDQNNTLASVAYLKEAVDTLESLSSDIKGNDSQKKLFAKANDKQNIYQTLITQLVEAGEVKTAWVYQEKLNVYGLQEQTRGVPTRGADDANEEQMELAELELKVDGIYSQLMNEKAKPAGQRSEEKIKELEKVMSVASENYSNYFWTLVDNGVISNDFANTVSPEALEQKRFELDKDIMILEYLVADDQIIIFMASADALGAKVIEIPKANIEAYINGYYNLLVNQASSDAINEAAAKLYTVLIEPILPFLGSTKKIGLVPSGILYKLPFQSLGKKENGKMKYLVEDFSIFYLNDISSMNNTEVLDASGVTLLAFGNADSSLEFAEKEVGMISQTFPGSIVYIKGDAHEDLAKKSMNDYKIVHFATHGNLDPINFNNSYLTMAPNLEAGEDGKLTMSEIRRIPTLRGCQLIVLSACNTAVNDQKLEGWVNNPAKAFLGKGAKSAIASLWSVDDAATGLLMQHFYQNLKAGENKVDALKHAQLKLINSEKFAHPYYWSAFELIGQWE